MRYSLAVVALAVAVHASPFAFPGGVTSAIAPKKSAPPGCKPSHSGSFGIAVMNISTKAKHKRQVSTIADGQPQAATTTAAVSTISDGQPQAPQTTLAPVTTIADGQPQAPTATACAASEIVDGQPQVCTSTVKMATMGHISQITDGQVQAGMHTMTMMPVSQISDGQPQAATVTYMPVSVISDGQPQAPQLPTKTECAASQVVDGQPQECTTTSKATTAVSELTEGQPQAPTASSSASAAAASATGTSYELVACKTKSTLSISLKNGILTDSVGRTGYIAANYQFQFDKPPQAGAIYTAGFSVCANGSMALGGSNVWWQCLSGNFYNLYDRKWAAQCSPVTIETLTLITC